MWTRHTSLLDICSVSLSAHSAILTYLHIYAYPGLSLPYCVAGRRRADFVHEQEEGYVNMNYVVLSTSNINFHWVFNRSLAVILIKSELNSLYYNDLVLILIKNQIRQSVISSGL
jgi:hypothetical protein